MNTHSLISGMLGLVCTLRLVVRRLASLHGLLQVQHHHLHLHLLSSFPN